MSAVSAPFDVVAIAASCGGVRALCELVESLPPTFPIPVAVVLHRGRDRGQRDLLAEILRVKTKLKVVSPSGGTPMRPGHLYIAPRDRHLYLQSAQRIAISVMPEVPLWRPSADVLFESVAEQCGARGIAVVLSGRMWDGAKGAAAVKAAGGRVFAQDRCSSAAFSMPRAAIQAGAAEICMSPRHIGSALAALALVPGADRLFRMGEGSRRWRFGSLAAFGQV
jgi:two-component system chemotaxis response regulator CheB